MNVIRLRVWDVIEYEGEYEDYNERIHESFTCPVLAGLCARRRFARLDGTDYWWDEYHGISVRTHLLNATIGGCHA